MKLSEISLSESTGRMYNNLLEIKGLCDTASRAVKTVAYPVYA